jgi:hypothetical protein
MVSYSVTAGDMSDEEIEVGRAHDRAAWDGYFGEQPVSEGQRTTKPAVAAPVRKRRWWQRILGT